MNSSSTEVKIGNKFFNKATGLLIESLPYVPPVAGNADNFVDAAWRATVKAGPISLEYGIEDLAADIISGQPVWCWGHLGCGKSAAVVRIAAGLEWPLVKFVNNADKTEEDIVGSFQLRNGETVWVDGPMITAMRIGAIFLVEEPSHGDMLKPIHSAAEKGVFTITRTGETVVAHKNFRIVATDNDNHGGGGIAGTYAASRSVDAATRSRFTLTYKVDYPKIDAEREIIASHVKDNSMVNTICEFAQEVRKLFKSYHDEGAAEGAGISSPIPTSTRAMISWAQQAQLTGDLDKAFAKTVLSSAPESDSTVCAEVYQRISNARILESMAENIGSEVLAEAVKTF